MHAIKMAQRVIVNGTQIAIKLTVIKFANKSKISLQNIKE